eukprot:scaffold39_cov66-Phaeocystis_antarctica.AAC.4
MATVPCLELSRRLTAHFLLFGQTGTRAMCRRRLLLAHLQLAFCRSQPVACTGASTFGRGCTEHLPIGVVVDQAGAGGGQGTPKQATLCWPARAGTEHLAATFVEPTSADPPRRGLSATVARARVGV